MYHGAATSFHFFPCIIWYYDADAENETKPDKIPSRGQVIIIFHMALLETVKTMKGDFELLNWDDFILNQIIIWNKK